MVFYPKTYIFFKFGYFAPFGHAMSKFGQKINRRDPYEFCHYRRIKSFESNGKKCFRYFISFDPTLTFFFQIWSLYSPVK